MVDLEFNKNDDKMRLLISEMRRRHAEIALGGGKKSPEKVKGAFFSCKQDGTNGGYFALEFYLMERPTKNLGNGGLCDFTNGSPPGRDFNCNRMILICNKSVWVLKHRRNYRSFFQRQFIFFFY